MALGKEDGTRMRSLDFAGFAQEFLRRNPAYVRDYRAVMRSATGQQPSIEQEEMAQEWGLSFSLFT